MFEESLNNEAISWFCGNSTQCCLSLCIFRLLHSSYWANVLQKTNSLPPSLPSHIHQIFLYLAYEYISDEERQEIAVHQITSMFFYPYLDFFKVATRLVFNIFAFVFMLYCLGYIPVSTVTTIFNMGPVFIYFIEVIYYKVSAWIFSISSIMLVFY